MKQKHFTCLTTRRQVGGSVAEQRCSLVFVTIISFIMILVSSCQEAAEYPQVQIDPQLRIERMQKFVIDISAYARALKPGFIIIPQNGEELAYNNANPAVDLNDSYLDAIDGIGAEEVFYDGEGSSVGDNSRLDVLDELKNAGKKIMVSDYLKKENFPASVSANSARGFISFQREKNDSASGNDNYDYSYIPDGTPADVNAADITSLEEAQNYLYLIGSAKYTNKTAIINAVDDTNYDVVLIDLFAGDFENNAVAFEEADIAKLRVKNNGGKRLVICYINIGAAENYRYYWQQGWTTGNPPWLENSYKGYPDEYWVEYWYNEWRTIIFNKGIISGNDGSYMKKIIDAGFDGAYLDNVEAYSSVYD